MADFAPNPRSSPTLITGTRGPESDASERLIADVEDDIVFYRPTAAPFMTLTNKFRGKRTSTQRRYDWFEKDEYPNGVVLSAASLVDDTSLDVETGTGSRIAAGYVLLNTRTRESVYVTSVSTDTLTVTRAIGGDQADMNSGDTLVLTRPVAEDGAGLGALKTTQAVNKFNYTETIRWAFGFTGRQLNTDLYGGNDRDIERKVAGIQYKKMVERMYFFGRRNKITGSGGHEVTFSGGAEDFIQTNIWDVTGISLTERALVDTLEIVMQEGKGGNRNGEGIKYLFCSAPWLTFFEFIGKSQVRYEPLDEELGLSARSYTSTHGKLMLVATPTLDENHPDWAVLVDMNHVTPVIHQGRGAKLLKGRQANDVDGETEEYLGDVGIQWEFEHAHAIFKGLNVGV